MVHISDSCGQPAGQRLGIAFSVLMFLNFGMPVLAQQDEAGHVHILLVADTRGDADRNRDGKGDLGLDLDGQRMAKVFRRALDKQGLKGRYTIKLLAGAAVNKWMILRHYRELEPAANDTLVFYYTGHGSFDRNDGHQLTMRGEKPSRLLRSDLVGAMMRRRPRGVIILTDCCASADAPIFAGGARRKVPMKRLKLDGNGNGRVVRDLFFQTKGLVNITAARTGTWAQGSRSKGGSYFTIALAKLLDQPAKQFDKNRDNLVTWKEFFPFLEVQTEVESLAIIQRGRLRIARFHTPEAFVLPGDPNHQKAELPLVDLQKDLNNGGVLVGTSGHLKTTDPIYERIRRPHRYHEVQLKKGVTYSIELRSPEFDTYLYLEDANGNVVASNDDFAKDTTHSQIDFQPSASGRYRIIVSTFSNKQSGRYSLTVRPYVHHGKANLDKTDPLDRYCRNAYFKVHRVKVVAGRTYTIDLESNTLDTYLRIQDRHGNTICLDDDSGGNLNSRLYFTPRAADTYYIIASTFRERTTGAYTLKIKQ